MRTLGLLAVLLAAPILRAEVSVASRQVYGLMWATPVAAAATAVPDLLTPHWKDREFSGPMFHAPSGLIFVGTSDRVMHALDLQRREVWHFEAGGSISSVPSVGSRWLTFGADDARLYALDPLRGELGWTFQADAEIDGPVQQHGDALYFATALDTLYCLDAASGDYRWHQRHPQPLGITLFGHASPALGRLPSGDGTARTVVAMGYADGSVALLEADTGRELWRAQIGSGEAFFDVDADPVITGHVLVAAAASGGITAVELSTGQTLWHNATDGMTRLGLKDKVLVAAGAGQAAGVDLVSGRTLWTFKFGKGTASRPVFDRGKVLFTSDAGAMYVLDLITGEPRQIFGSPLGMAGAPDVTDDLVLVVSNGGWLYALSSKFAGWAHARRD
ncbi:MAG: PQQ-binding-like beta-propeller repeat protein [Pseudomonadota bacterium]